MGIQAMRLSYPTDRSKKADTERRSGARRLQCVSNGTVPRFGQVPCRLHTSGVDAGVVVGRWLTLGTLKLARFRTTFLVKVVLEKAKLQFRSKLRRRKSTRIREEVVGLRAGPGCSGWISNWLASMVGVGMWELSDRG